MARKPTEVRIEILLPGDLFDGLEAWRAEKRIFSRGAAIRQLIREAIAAKAEGQGAQS